MNNVTVSQQALNTSKDQLNVKADDSQRLEKKDAATVKSGNQALPQTNCLLHACHCMKALNR
ncbi:MAG: hypothetical protein QX197_02130 [Methylococcaceae bacterium]